jgi:hypothetical protein
VELYGIVDSRAYKDVAFIRADGCCRFFSAKSYLQVSQSIHRGYSTRSRDQTTREHPLNEAAPPQRLCPSTNVLG